MTSNTSDIASKILADADYRHTELMGIFDKQTKDTLVQEIKRRELMLINNAGDSDYIVDQSNEILEYVARGPIIEKMLSDATSDQKECHCELQTAIINSSKHRYGKKMNDTISLEMMTLEATALVAYLKAKRLVDKLTVLLYNNMFTIASSNYYVQKLFIDRAKSTLITTNNIQRFKLAINLTSDREIANAVESLKHIKSKNNIKTQRAATRDRLVEELRLLDAEIKNT